jgi:hypothetical protein
MDSVGSTTPSADLAVPEENQTDIMSQKLFANLMVLQDSGTLDDQSISDLADNIASEVDASSTPEYQLSDLTIINNASIEQIKDYANQFWTIRQKYVDLYKQNPLGSTNFVADPSDPSFISGFTATGNLYIQMAAELSKLPVPSDLADFHLKLLNNYVASGLGLEKLSQLNSDPVATISGLTTYSEYSDYETTILEIMAKYFSESGIIFSDSDPGAGWNTI